VQANGIRISFPHYYQGALVSGVLRVLLELGTASKTGADASVSAHAPVHILLEMRLGGKNTILIAHPAINPSFFTV